MASAHFIAVLLLFLVVFLILRINATVLFRPRNTVRPPGPKGKPFVGNLLDIPSSHSWIKFKQWADEYGPLFRLNIAGSEHYIISTEKIANALLRERGTIYSSRGGSTAAATLLCRDLAPVFLPYNELWRRGRKLIHDLTNSKMATSYQPVQVFESTRLLFDLIQSPSDYERLFERYSSAVIFKLGFGKTVITGDEEYVRLALKGVHEVERVASPGAYLVDQFPMLNALPKSMAPFKQELERLGDESMRFNRRLQDDIRQAMRVGKAPDCWERTFLEKKSDYGLSDDEGAYAVGTLFGAGSGTTAAAMMSFMLAMVHHPEWQELMQKEVDQQVGFDRLPEFEDMSALPTVRAFVKEVLRWRPVTAGGIPHLLVKDDVYNGFFFPAGTNVHANQWAIHRDPELYPEPETFNPSRWLDPKYPTYREPLSVYPNLRNFSAFGFGRRICPGLNIAERSLNILAARIAWACEIKRKRDSLGYEIDVPLYDYTAGFNTQPKWFPFDLEARSREKWDLVKACIEEMHQPATGGQ